MSRRVPSAPAFALALLLAITQSASATLDSSGKWAAPWDWGHTAVHMMLLPPGNSGFHSRVVWWEDNHTLTTFEGGMWGWTANSTSDCSAGSEYQFSHLGMGTPPDADVFCAGHTQMRDNGRLFVSGGTEHGEVGITNTFIFDPDDTLNHWTAGPVLTTPRWYPTNTRLADGQILTTSGSLYWHEHVFGGRQTGGTTPNSTLRRLGLSLGGAWDANITTTSDPASTWPPALEGGTIVAITSSQTHGVGAIDAAVYVDLMFGGDKLNTGSGYRQSISDAWFPHRSNQQLSGDYGYYFQSVIQRFLPGSQSSSGLLPRSDHTMTAMGTTASDSMSVFVFGGRRFSGSGYAALNDLWRLFWNANPNDSSDPYTGWTWKLESPGGTPPSARFGHSAVYDPFHKRILIFGGTSDSSTTGLDNAIYALDVTDPKSPAWSTPPVTVFSGSAPAARFGHRMALDLVGRTRVINSASVPDQYGAVLFGGKTVSGLDANAYVLWINSAPESLRLEWQQLTTTGTVPSGRVFTTLLKDVGNDRWVVFGGDTGGSADLRASALTLDRADASQATWTRLGYDADISVAHAMVMSDRAPIFARTAESFSADVQSHSNQTGSVLLQDWFPFQWVLPDSSVFTVAAGDSSYRLSSPGSSWSRFPTQHNDVTFNGGSAVMYRPGKILTAGVRQTQNGQAAGNTAWIEPLADTMWTSGSAMGSHRTNLNLVALPNGKVMAVGGTLGKGDQTDTSAVRTPEIWDPDTHSWSGSTTLANQAMIRDYHSTAILLPDGRILSAGGNSTGGLPYDNPSYQNLYKAEIFCPPYLFKSDGSLAPRPVIDGVADTIRCGHDFTLCTSEDSVTRVSLIAPGAPTHAFDQNQRFIPLTFTKASNPTRLLVQPPSGTGIAPPGPYLLFLTGARDGSTLYSDVPSIAAWVQVRSDSFVDNCDVTAPGTRKPTLDVVGPTYVDLYWDDPADDNLQSVSGKALNYAFHYSSKPIITQTAWDSSRAVALGLLPAPGPVGTTESYELTGLHSGSTYHLALRSRDDGQNYSALHDSLKIHTTGGGGGGGSGLRGTGGLASVTPQGSGAPEASLTPEAPSQLSVRTDRVVANWQVTMRRDSTLAGVSDDDAGSLLFQASAGGGTWTTERHFAPPVSGGSVGYCGLHDGQRTVFAGGFALTEIAPVLNDGTGGQALVAAHHSRLGDLTLTSGEPISPELQVGDSLVLSYSGSGAIPEWDDNWYALVTPPSSGAGARQRPGVGTHGAGLPLEFALGQNIPNPFRGITRIPFALPRASHVKLEVFDLLGRRVRTLAEGAFAAGRYTIEWDRRDANGNTLHSGVFMYRMTAGSFTDHRKLVITGN